MTKRQQAPRSRGAGERATRVAEALACLPQMQGTKDAQKRLYAKAKQEKVTDAHLRHRPLKRAS